MKEKKESKESKETVDLKNDLTVILCSYKANKAFKLCLHQLARFGFTGKNLLIYENSPSDYVSNRELLKAHNITFIDNPGGMYFDTVNKAFNEVKTNYALLLDSDCFCIINPFIFLQNMVNHKLSLFGDISSSHNGYKFRKRVDPCWCMIDMNFIKTNNIQFTDIIRMQQTNSMSFILTNELGLPKDPNQYYYNAGSTMLEDVLKCSGIVADVGDNKPYIHPEGMSWKHDFKQFEQDAVRADNWVGLLYDKLLFDEKFLDNLSNK